MKEEKRESFTAKARDPNFQASLLLNQSTGAYIPKGILYPSRPDSSVVRQERPKARGKDPYPRPVAKVQLPLEDTFICPACGVEAPNEDVPNHGTNICSGGTAGPSNMPQPTPTAAPYLPPPAPLALSPFAAIHTAGGDSDDDSSFDCDSCKVRNLPLEVLPKHGEGTCSFGVVEDDRAFPGNSYRSAHTLPPPPPPVPLTPESSVPKKVNETQPSSHNSSGASRSTSSPHAARESSPDTHQPLPSPPGQPLLFSPITSAARSSSTGFLTSSSSNASYYTAPDDELPPYSAFPTKSRSALPVPAPALPEPAMQVAGLTQETRFQIEQAALARRLKAIAKQPARPPPRF